MRRRGRSSYTRSSTGSSDTRPTPHVAAIPATDLEHAAGKRAVVIMEAPTGLGVEPEAGGAVGGSPPARRARSASRIPPTRSGRSRRSRPHSSSPYSSIMRRNGGLVATRQQAPHPSQDSMTGSALGMVINAGAIGKYGEFHAP